MSTDYAEVWQILSESVDPPDALEAYVGGEVEKALRRAYSFGAWGELVEERNKARALMMNAEGVAAGETYLREQAEEKLAMVHGLLVAYGDPEDGSEPPFEFIVQQIGAAISDSDRVCGCSDE